MAIAALAAGGGGALAADVHWTYEGHEGPEHWGELAEDFAACGTGVEQSPIDLTAPVEADLPDIELHWNAPEWTVVNNGHTIQANASDAGYAVIDGTTYTLLQFHFHTPSEHAIDGDRYPMEVHFVHAAEDGNLAVIGVMMEGGGANDLFGAIMAAAPSTPGEAAIGAGDPSGLLGDFAEFWRYDGSLTTPPCSEVVLWTVLDGSIQVAQADIDAFAALFPMNARPLQAVNDREVMADD